jgi:hypothetical protein
MRTISGNDTYIPFKVSQAIPTLNYKYDAMRVTDS